MSKIAIFFPGIGYHCDKPLLYYSYKAAGDCGYDERIKLAYSYECENIRGNEAKMQAAFEALYEQAEEQLALLDFTQYDEILFISKSVGTVIASAYAKKHNILCRHVLYTPLIHTYGFETQNAIAFIGTKDPWSDVDKVIAISEEKGIPIYRYKNANHSLEVGKSLEDIKILEDVMKKTGEFLC